jgi:hypothetical protein
LILTSNTRCSLEELTCKQGVSDEEVLEYNKRKKREEEKTNRSSLSLSLSSALLPKNHRGNGFFKKKEILFNTFFKTWSLTRWSRQIDGGFKIIDGVEIRGKRKNRWGVCLVLGVGRGQFPSPVQKKHLYPSLVFFPFL